MMNTTATTLLVRKDHLQTTTLQSTPLSTLADGQVRVGIDRFALTSNNITYAAMGDFYDSLNPGQQQKVRELMQRRRGWMGRYKD